MTHIQTYTHYLLSLAVVSVIVCPEAEDSFSSSYFTFIAAAASYFQNGKSYRNKMNKKFVSILLCCWPEDLFDSASDLWSSRKVEDMLVQAIRNGDFDALIRIFERGSPQLRELHVTVYRKNLQHLCNCWLDHNSKDGLVYLYQESSPLLWAVDCHQWDMLRFMVKRGGLDPNLPQVCRRWTSFYSKLSVVPYTKSWVKGKCTYQSVLDYYFASVYELMLSDPHQHTLADYHDYFDEFPDILQNGVDVHRIDSIIIFNLLATSFDLAIRRHDLDDHVRVTSSSIPSPPQHPTSKTSKFTEMKVVVALIENGFSQLDFIEYLNPCYNWFGILICLLSHPGISSRPKFGDGVPFLIQDAALLLINLLAMRNIFSPDFVEFEDNYDHLNLRKFFVKQFTDQRLLFNDRVNQLRHLCAEQKSKPLKLKFLVRTVIRKNLGGKRFLSKLKSLELPSELEKFISYINVSHLKSTDFPPLLVSLALGNPDQF